MKATAQRFGFYFTTVALALAAVLSLDFLAMAIVGARGLEADAWRVEHPDYHHGFAPNRSGVHVWPHGQYPYFTNSLGLKDGRVREVANAKTGRRVLLIGDSFTEGVGVAWEETFAGRLEAALAPAGTEVLNAGVLSYSPTLYLKKVRHLIGEVGLEVDEVVCLVDLSDMKDEAIYALPEEERATATHATPSPWVAFKVWATSHSLILNTLYVARLRMHNRPALGRPRGMWTLDESLLKEVESVGIPNALKHMDELYRFLEVRDIALTVAVYPWPDQIQHRDLDSLQVRIWRDFAQERSLRFINLFPDFINGEEFEEVYRKYFIPNDVHWNPEGHALVARLLLERHFNRNPESPVKTD